MMRRWILRTSRILPFLWFLVGCGLMPPQSPVTGEDRAVTPLQMQEKQVVFKEAMVWLDRTFSPTRGIRFPEGVYTLEAEDKEYYYFRAPRDIEYRVFEDGRVVDGNFMPGGLYLGKKLLMMVPAGAYLSVNEQNKTMTWRLGGDFLRMEGRTWERNFR